MDKKISVITICFNAAADLPRTMESVLAQDLEDFEYVIQDGGSTDATPEIIEKYRAGFAEKNIRFVYNRESDGGIYDAMNKGVRSATGDYINFMNAGDCFYDAGVLTKITETIENASEDPAGIPSVIYGDCAVFEYGRFYRFPKSLEKIDEVMPFSHQSVFASRQLLSDHPFNTSYRYSADYDFLLTAYDLDERFADAGIVVCITTADGLSSVNYHDTLMESARILKAHNRFHHTEKELGKTEKMLRLKQFVLDHFPVFVKKWIRNRQIISRGQDFTAVIPPWFHLTKK